MIENTFAIIMLSAVSIIVSIILGQIALYHFYLEEKLFNKLNTRVFNIVDKKIIDITKTVENEMKHESCNVFGELSDNKKTEINDALSAIVYLMEEQQKKDKAQLLVKGISEEAIRDYLGSDVSKQKTKNQ